MSASYEGHLYLPAAHYRPGRTQNPTVIVVHDAECVLGTNIDTDIAAYFHNQPQSTANPTSAHAVADSDSVTVCVKDEDTAYHCGTNGNRIGLGIEQGGRASFGPAQWDSPLARAQIGYVAQHVAHWCTKWAIPPVRIGAAQLLDGKRGICGHIDITHAWPVDTHHTDPGASYPWDALMAHVHAILNPAPPPPSSVPREPNMPAMYMRATGPFAGHAILLENGKQAVLNIPHGNAFSKAGVPYAQVKDATQDAVYDRAYGPVVG